jgi:fumarate hydratase subunit beta
MIGKGKRSAAVIEAMRRAGAVYFGATGGAGALISDRIKGAELVAFPELGAEAIRRFVVEDFPAVVIIDSRGNNLYLSGREAYLQDRRNAGR